MSKDFNRIIAKFVLKAQASSDSGKNLYAPYGNHKTAYGAYNTKTYYILQALKTISGLRDSCWNYYVITDDDQNGYPSVITYFDWKVSGEKRRQISFHTPMSEAKSNGLTKWVSKGRKTRWDHKPAGSREACEFLMGFYGLDGKIK